MPAWISCGVRHEGELSLGDPRTGGELLHHRGACRDATEDFRQSRPGLRRRTHAGQCGTLAGRPQGGRLERGLHQGDLQGRAVEAIGPGGGEDRRQVGGGDGVSVRDHLRVAVHVGRHGPVESDLEFVGAGPLAEIGDGDRVHGVDRCVHHAPQIRRQATDRHGVGREHVLAVRPLEQQIRRHHVHAGIASGRVLDDQESSDRLVPAGRRQLDGREVAALLCDRFFLGEASRYVPGAEHGREGDCRRQDVEDPRLRALDPRATPAAQPVAAVSLTPRHGSRCTTRVRRGPPLGRGR